MSLIINDFVINVVILKPAFTVNTIPADGKITGQIVVNKTDAIPVNVDNFILFTIAAKLLFYAVNCQNFKPVHFSETWLSL